MPRGTLLKMDASQFDAHFSIGSYNAPGNYSPSPVESDEMGLQIP